MFLYAINNIIILKIFLKALLKYESHVRELSSRLKEEKEKSEKECRELSKQVDWKLNS